MNQSDVEETMGDLSIQIRDGVRDYCSPIAWKKRFPISLWLPRYKANYLISDIVAGFTVGLTVVPQSLAYASIAKLSIEYGLYSSFMGCFVYFFLGTSKDVTVGPTAIMSLLVATYGEKDPRHEELHLPEYAIVLALLCGIVQFLLGVFRAGALTGFISSAVIAGFTSASAITIAMGQVKHILGQSYHADTFLDDIILTFKYIKETNGWDVFLGLACMVLLYLLQKVKNDSLKWEKDEDYTPTNCQVIMWRFLWFIGTSKNAVIVVASAAMCWSLQQYAGVNVENHIQLTGMVNGSIPTPEVPSFPKDTFQVLNVGLAIIPLIGYLEAISIGKSFARENNYKVESNQELIALGSCNIAGSFFSSYPVTGSFSRTAVNSQCGVKTPVSGLVTGSLVLLSLQFLTPAFYYIPKAALAAVIIMAVIKMFNYRMFIALWKVRKLDLLTLVVTFFMCLGLGVAYGTLVGIALDLIILLYPIARPSIRQVDLGEMYDVSSKSQLYRNSVIVVEVDRSMRFPATEYIVESLYQLSLGAPHPKPVILDFTHVTGVDYTMIEGLSDALEDFTKAGIKLVFCSVNNEITEQFLAYQLKHLVFYSNCESAINGLADDNSIDEATAHITT